MLRHRIADEPDAIGRLHRFVVEYYQVCRPASPAKSSSKASGPPIMVDFAQQLLTGHPAEAATAFAPLVELFGDLLDEAAADGAIRPGLRQSPIAGVVLEAIMFNAFSVTIGGTFATESVEDQAEELWDLVLHGIGAPA
jgi:hypothetical protein